jgi:hypothetical protein
MTDFLAKSPTLDSNWRAVVLFGRNVASYKLALAKTLLAMANRADDRVSLEEPAAPFAGQICEHLSQVDKQTTSRSSQFKDRGEMPDADGVWNLVLACQRYNRGEGGKFLRCRRHG